MKGFYMCGDPREAFCAFDQKTRRPYCRCSTYDYLYYAKERRCLNCDCGDAGTCSLVDGVKTCVCNEGAAVSHQWYVVSKTDKCLECNCGDNSLGCSFDGPLKVCKCPKGFAHRHSYEGDSCDECDCGPHGECYFSVIFKSCRCNAGYRTLVSEDGTNVTCSECDCGQNGGCSFKNGVKQCSCYRGYEAQNGLCTDLNECDDIDLCPRVHTTCRNLPGSYDCTCEHGYQPITLPDSLKIVGCGTPKSESNRKNELSPWKLAFIILCVMMCIFIVVIFIVFFIKRKSMNRSSHATDATLQKY